MPATSAVPPQEAASCCSMPDAAGRRAPAGGRAPPQQVGSRRPPCPFAEVMGCHAPLRETGREASRPPASTSLREGRPGLHTRCVGGPSRTRGEAAIPTSAITAGRHTAPSRSTTPWRIGGRARFPRRLLCQERDEKTEIRVKVK
ncbi:unnamed protein product [Urochloa humidicola]